MYLGDEPLESPRGPQITKEGFPMAGGLLAHIMWTSEAVLLC